MANEFETSRPAMEATIRTRHARSKPQPGDQSRLLPPYGVILYNDNLNSFEFVVCVLQRVFHYDLHRAFDLTRQAHETGRSIVWTGCLEVAELKADQIRSCGADPVMKDSGASPLRVGVERQ